MDHAGECWPTGRDAEELIRALYRSATGQNAQLVMGQVGLAQVACDVMERVGFLSATDLTLRSTATAPAFRLGQCGYACLTCVTGEAFPAGFLAALFVSLGWYGRLIIRSAALVGGRGICDRG